MSGEWKIESGKTPYWVKPWAHHSEIKRILGLERKINDILLYNSNYVKKPIEYYLKPLEGLWNTLDQDETLLVRILCKTGDRWRCRPKKAQEFYINFISQRILEGATICPWPVPNPYPIPPIGQFIELSDLESVLPRVLISIIYDYWISRWGSILHPLEESSALKTNGGLGNYNDSIQHLIDCAIANIEGRDWSDADVISNFNIIRLA